MKHDKTLPTCQICSSLMEESRERKIALDHICSVCGYATDIDILQAIKEEAIINGKFDKE